MQIPKLNSRNRLARWAFFAVFLALMQLWVLVLFKFLREEDIEFYRIMCDGVLIFYANSIAMNIFAQRWNVFRIVAMADLPARFSRDAMLLYEMLLPLVILVLSVITYCALLSAESPGSRIVVAEGILVVLALACSLIHDQQIAMRYGKAEG